MTQLPVRLGIQQRILPAYRVPFSTCLLVSAKGGYPFMQVIRFP